MEPEQSAFLTSDYVTKLPSSGQYGIDTKLEYRPTEQYRKPRNKSLHLSVPYSWQGDKNIQCGKENLFNKRPWENWTATGERMKLEHS